MISRQSLGKKRVTIGAEVDEIEIDLSISRIIFVYPLNERSRKPRQWALKVTNSGKISLI
jgi:hypothetical protein